MPRGVLARSRPRGTFSRKCTHMIMLSRCCHSALFLVWSLCSRFIVLCVDRDEELPAVIRRAFAKQRLQRRRAVLELEGSCRGQASFSCSVGVLSVSAGTTSMNVY